MKMLCSDGAVIRDDLRFFGILRAGTGGGGGGTDSACSPRTGPCPESWGLPAESVELPGFWLCGATRACSASIVGGFCLRYMVVSSASRSLRLSLKETLLPSDSASELAAVSGAASASALV